MSIFAKGGGARGARERKRRQLGKCEGRKGHHELRPAAVRMAKHLAPVSRNGKRRSLRRIAADMAAMRHVNEAGRPFAAASIKAVIDGPMPAVDPSSGRVSSAANAARSEAARLVTGSAR
jgi:hypothetical protein